MEISEGMIVTVAATADKAAAAVEILTAVAVEAEDKVARVAEGNNVQM